MYAHRRSKHPTPARFHESTTVEVIWTVIPVLILAAMAIPATLALRDIEDNSDADLTVLITASQWKWHYEYVEAGIGYYSNLATPQAQIDGLEPKNEFYLLEVDNPLVAYLRRPQILREKVKRRDLIPTGTDWLLDCQRLKPVFEQLDLASPVVSEGR